MPTTSNFGWTTPADTDLVKDGAAAIRTLGNGIDTSLVDLKGGTTGQVLTKATNADLDYTWTTPQVGDITEVAVSSPITGGGTSGSVTIGIQDATTAQKGAVQLTNSVSSTSTTTAATPSSVKTAYDLADAAIAKSFVNAKGDLISASANDTPAILTAGSNGETLVADSSTSTGLRYNPQNALANPVINGGMDVWQRGTSLSIAASTNFGASSFMADRWQTQTGANQACTISRQTVSDSTNLPNIQYALRFQRNSGQTGTGTLQFYQNFETANSIPLAGKTITVSFYARKGANYSDAASDVNCIGWQGTGTDQNIWSGFTSASTFLDSNVVLTTSWQRFAVTATIASATRQISLGFRWDPTGTAGADDWLEITGVQIDVGTYTASSAPTFRRSGGTLAGELSLCRRYLPAVRGGTATAAGGYIGYAYGTNTTIYVIPFDVPARVSPTGITVSGTIRAFALNVGTTVTPTFNSASVNSSYILATPTITAGQGSRLDMDTDSLILFTGCEL